MDEANWRKLVGLVVCALFCVRFYSHIRGRTWDGGRTVLGPLFFIQAALTVPALAGLILFIFYPPAISWASMRLPEEVRDVGLLLVCIATALLAWTQYSLGGNFSPLIRIRKDQQLITSGPYRFARHPMYVAISILSIGMALLTANWLIGGSWILCTALVLFFRTPIEEQILLDAFGDRYREYMNRTTRFFPRVLPPPRVTNKTPPEELVEHSMAQTKLSTSSERAKKEKNTMKLGILIGTFILAALSASAQVPAAPAQPTSGPGGSNYPYGVVQNGPYAAGTHTTLGAYSYYIFEPVGLAPTVANPHPLPAPATAPVVLFIHGFDGNTVTPYYYWMTHMAQMGFTTIWAEYDYGLAATLFDHALVEDFKAALLTLKLPGHVPPLVDGSGNVQYSIVGHSSGAWLAFSLASKIGRQGLPVPRAIVAIEPGQGKIPAFTATNIDPKTLILTVVGDADRSNRLCQAVSVWSSLTQIPPVYKPFLLVRTDSHGTPVQEANHWFPLTNTTKDTVPQGQYAVDDRDFNITYKLSVAVSHCAIDGQYCDIALGNSPPNSYGATTQTDMGLWSDGVPVLPLVFEVNPPVAFTCK